MSQRKAIKRLICESTLTYDDLEYLENIIETKRRQMLPLEVERWRKETIEDAEIPQEGMLKTIRDYLFKDDREKKDLGEILRQTWKDWEITKPLLLFAISDPGNYSACYFWNRGECYYGDCGADRREDHSTNFYSSVTNHIFCDRCEEYLGYAPEDCHMKEADEIIAKEIELVFMPLVKKNLTLSSSSSSSSLQTSSHSFA